MNTTTYNPYVYNSTIDNTSAIDNTNDVDNTNNTFEQMGTNADADFTATNRN